MKNLTLFPACIMLLLIGMLSTQSCKEPCRKDLIPILSPRFERNKITEYCTDIAGYPYETNNLIIEFDESVSQARIDDLIALLRPDDIDACLCSPRIQNWKWDMNQIINIEEKVSQVNGQSRGEGDISATPNYLNYLANNEELPQFQDGLFPGRGKDSNQVDGTPDGKLIAILDTGLDGQYALDHRINLNGEEISECLPAHVFGWNFIRENANISDDHGHGTAVAGLIAESLGKASANAEYACGARFLILKTLDSRGVGNLFDAICALDLAAKAGAEVINISWGYYGHDIPMMKRMINSVSPGVVVTSLGNDGSPVDQEIKHYPSEYAAMTPHVVAVAGDVRAMIWEKLSARQASMVSISDFSNFTITRSMITAPSTGVEVWASYNAPSPPAYRSGNGTSYSAGLISAAVAIHQCCFSGGTGTYLRGTTEASMSRAGQAINLRNIVLESTLLCEFGS